MTEKTNPFLELFEDPEHAARYADGPAKFMPGFRDMHRMAGVLIREYAPPNARVLVHGAGGGLEIEAFARENPDWTFLGVEPAKPMLDEAKIRLGDLNERVTLHHGYAEDAPAGPFDAATSLLTLHFLNAEERQKTVSEIVRRLKPGSPFVTAHCSFPQDSKDRDAWLIRHREFVVASGVDAEEAENARKDIAESLDVLDPETDERILRDAGLSDVTVFYTAFTWRGWFGRVV
ncbi:MAG: methyltransferase domain-containing protein [Woeseiaceae bacterium]|nr:methyltransferase domain-containing protein [Woeseiaceae bacterium]